MHIILGIAKALRAITFVVPGLAKLKEWAYADFTFTWISAFFGAFSGERWPTSMHAIGVGVGVGVGVGAATRDFLFDPASKSPMAR